MNRRTFLLNSALAAAATPFTRAQAPPDITVHTPLGSLRGATDNGIRIFRGVPYAQPPIGPLRFRPPQPVQPWTGVRDALHFSPAATQPGDRKPQSEDCLYLNVWAPSTPGPHPVFVWIHGGGFTGGASSEPLYDGRVFAREDIVLITVAYRLGVFGFLDVGPLLGPTYNGSANNALRDLIAALQWVQQNIASFGGDPHRVTIGGESAGAKLTDLLMGVPSAAPLFQQMISESGGAERFWSPQQAADVAHGFAAEWHTAAPKRSINDLLTAPAHELIPAQQRLERNYPAHFPLRVEIDSQLFPSTPLASIRSGSARGKRLLLGTNRDESASFIGTHPTHDPESHDLGNMRLADFDPILRRYAELYPDPELRRIRAVSAEEYLVPSLRVAESLTTGHGTAFVYRLDYPSPPSSHFASFAPHGYDLGFVWDAPSTHTPAAAAALNESIRGAWCSFIRGEIPQAPGLPPWPAYNLTSRPTMLLDAHPTIAENPSGSELALWSTFLTN